MFFCLIVCMAIPCDPFTGLIDEMADNAAKNSYLHDFLCEGRSAVTDKLKEHVRYRVETKCLFLHHRIETFELITDLDFYRVTHQDG